MDFDAELKDMLEQARANGTPHEDVEAAVAELHRKHGRQVPPPITGTLSIVEPDNSFGQK